MTWAELEKVVAVPDEYSSIAFATLIKTDTDAYREKLDKMEKDKAKKAA